MQAEFENKVALVTGAGKGLGRAYARYLASGGARVVVNNRCRAGEREASADRTVTEILDDGGIACADYNDVEQMESGRRMVDLALDTYGALDIAIANAGVSEACAFHNQTLEELQHILQINLMGTINVAHAAFKHMYREGSGRLLLSTSAAGLCGEHGLPGYSASKAGLLGLMYALHLEGSPKGISVNAIAPYAATQMTAEHLSPDLLERLTADAVAPVAAWLVSEGCPLSGEIVIAGGGKLSRAKMHETESREIGGTTPRGTDGVSSAWQRLAAEPFSALDGGANAHFRRFVASGQNQEA